MSEGGDACRCCGRPIGEEGRSARAGICIACARTRAASDLPREGDTAPPGGPPAGGDPLELTDGLPPGVALPEPGTDLGGLVVERRLGQGGMGLVLVARDPGLDRRVAVKFLRGNLVGNSRAEKFFRREGRALAGLAHPSVVRVFSVGSWKGWPFLVMELVEGVTLAERIRRGALPLAEALRVAEEVAGALAAVHAAGIVHRDVNPSNVVLRKGDGSACLIDFGLAKVLERATETSGAIAGTPLYMAPEQVARRGQDHRVDIYSFGATLFEMVAGSPPHGDADAASFFRTVLHEDPPLLRSVAPGAPRALEVLLARALSRAPELRQADGRVLLEEVRGVRRALEAPGRAAEGVGEGAATDGAPASPAAPPRDPSEPLPLLGRNREYATAAAVLDRLDDRRGQVLLLEGEAGAGKSRLLREVERTARARACGVVRCAGAEYSGIPFRALRSALLEYGRDLGSQAPEDLVAFTLRAAPGNGPLAPALRWFLDPGRHEEGARPGRSDLVRAVLALLRALLAVRPVLLAAEDGHLLDGGSLDLLVAAAEEGTDWPLGIALSFRPPDASEPHAPLPSCLPRLRGVPGAVEVVLGPLSEAAVATMIHLGLGIDEAEACRLAPLLHRKSSGNPLYLVEAIKLLEQERRAEKGRGRTRFRQKLTSMAIPPRLMEVAVRRTSGLPPLERDALGVASVDAEGVTADLVARCLDVSRLQALRVLQHLVSTRGLLRVRGDRYWIAHGEIRDAVYGELVPELRAAYHAEAAGALAGAGAADSEPSRLGLHLLRSGDAAAAAPHLLEAGRRMLHGHSPAEALELFEEAERCAGDAGSPAAAVGRAQALELLGEMDPAREILERLVAAGGAAAAEALLPLAEFERNRGRHREVLALLERAGGLPLPDDRRIRLHLLEAQALSQLDLGEEALAVLERAEARAGEASAVRRLELANTQGTVRWRLARFEEAHRHFAEALPIAERLGALDRTAILLYNLALVSSDLRKPDEALAWVDRAIERALLAGNQRTLVYARLLRAEILVEGTRTVDAAEVLDQIAETLEELESSDARILHATCRAELELQSRRYPESLRWTETALTLARDAPRHEAPIRALRARVLLAEGRPAAALEESRRILEGPIHPLAPGFEEEALALACRSLRELGSEGPERIRLRGMSPGHSCIAAAEKAMGSSSPSERNRWGEEALRLARNPRSRAYVLEWMDAGD